MNSQSSSDLQGDELDLNIIYNNFTNRMSEIELSRRELKAIQDGALKNAIEIADEASKFAVGRPEIYNSRHVMIFNHPVTGKLTPYDFKEQSYDEKIENIKIQLNKHFCWLLAEAYEEFEDFLESIYAYVGYHMPEVWPMSDFGNISIREIKSQTQQWFLQQAKKKNCRAIITQINKEFSGVKLSCEKSKYYGNLLLKITMVEKMRHIIVHNGGRIKDKNQFFLSMFEGCGVPKVGALAEEYRKYMDYHVAILKKNGDCIVYLLDRPVKEMAPFNIATPIFEPLIGLLLAYASIFYENISTAKLDE